MAARIVHPPIQVGDRFGRLIVTGVFKIYSPDLQRNLNFCSAQCDCGKTVEKVRHQNLKEGATKSCGCLRKENTAKLRRRHPKEWLETLNIYSGAKTRCQNQKRKDYQRYGGAGVLFKFENIESLINCIGVRPENSVLDRIDTKGHYEPGNVRWVTAKENSQNKRNSNYWHTPTGVFESRSEAAYFLKLSTTTISKNVYGYKKNGKIYPPKNGWFVEKKYK